ncbi:hypothetical protein EQH57_1065, partial [Dictyocoela roeselum]
MKFNVDKCKVMHICPHNLKHKYSMSGKKLIPVTEKRDFDVIISNGNKMLGMISRTISYKNQHSMVKLFNAFVRPHLEYVVQFWSPFHRKVVIKFEKVPRRATKLIPSLRNKSYEDRLRELNLY